MRRIFFRLAAVSAAIAAAASQASAQPSGPAQGSPDDLSYTHAAPPLSRSIVPRPSLPGGIPPEISQAEAAAKKAGVDCHASNGVRLRSDSHGSLYEVSCRHDLGWLVAVARDGSAAAASCLAQAGASKGVAHCLLRSNLNQVPGLQALADKAKVSCRVTDGVWIGSGGNPPIVRYEATCADGGGYILDTPQPGTTSDLIATSCKDAPSLGLKCTLPPTPNGPIEGGDDRGGGGRRR